MFLVIRIFWQSSNQSVFINLCFLKSKLVISDLVISKSCRLTIQEISRPRIFVLPINKDNKLVYYVMTILLNADELAIRTCKLIKYLMFNYFIWLLEVTKRMIFVYDLKLITLFIEWYKPRCIHYALHGLPIN